MTEKKNNAVDSLIGFIGFVIITAIVFVFIYMAWYGAEMFIYGQSQRSAVDIMVAIFISMSVTSKMKKGVEKNELKRKFAEELVRGVIDTEKKRQEKDGKD